MLYHVLAWVLLIIGLVWTPADFAGHRARWRRLMEPQVTACHIVATPPANNCTAQTKI